MQFWCILCCLRGQERGREGECNAAYICTQTQAHQSIIIMVASHRTYLLCKLHGKSSNCMVCIFFIAAWSKYMYTIGYSLMRLFSWLASYSMFQIILQSKPITVHVCHSTHCLKYELITNIMQPLVAFGNQASVSCSFCYLVACSK